MVPEPLRRLYCKKSRESLPFPIPLYSIYDGTDQWKDLEDDEEEEGLIEETDSEGGAVSSSEYEDD